MEKSFSQQLTTTRIFGSYPAELMTHELAAAFNEWQQDKHSLPKWLALSKILAEQINAGSKDALALRDACILETQG